MIFLSVLAFICAVIPAALFCANISLYREPPREVPSQREAVSVLIPARNEEQSIHAAVESVLASEKMEFEVIVLDDSSTDQTAAIVRELAAVDARVRLEQAPPLPRGWNGKQHACYVLAGLARYDVLCFLDADVRLHPRALSRIAAFLVASRSDLVSGFPRQRTVTTLEWMLLPLIHFILLGFLPLSRMRASTSPALAAGCGQLMMLRRNAYRLNGGHSAIPSTMHDGLLLPRLFRMHGSRTDLADFTELATCRMYHNAGEVWKGLAKNATEGMAAPARILPFTALLFCGQILPTLLLMVLLLSGKFNLHSSMTLILLGALAASYLPRWLSMVRFHQRLGGAVLHPLAVMLLLILQWYALLRKLNGRPATWKARVYNVG